MKLLREPLIHFLALGAALFLIFGLVGDSDDERSDRLVVSAGQIEQLREGWTRTWQRPPTGAELDGLIDDYIREEVYYREALAMGLDRDDTIVRRRLRQKLEFFTDDLVATVDPTDQQLETYLNDHPDAFRTPSRSSFEQIYFNVDGRGAQAVRDAESLLERLNGPGPEIDTTAFGDSLMLERNYELVSEDDVAGLLGGEFAAALAALPVGRWSGPVKSGYGLHLVLVRRRQPGMLPTLAQVREAVEREWRAARRKEATDAFYVGLRARYEVSVERPGIGDAEDRSQVTEARP